MSNEVCVKSRVTLLCSHAHRGFLSSSMIFCSIDWPTKQWEIETSHLVIPQSKLHCNKFLCFIKPQSSWLLDYQFMINNLPSVDQAHPGHCCVICPWLSGLWVCITAVLKALLSMDLLAFFMWDIYDAVKLVGECVFPMRAVFYLPVIAQYSENLSCDTLSYWKLDVFMLKLSDHCQRRKIFWKYLPDFSGGRC